MMYAWSPMIQFLAVRVLLEADPKNLETPSVHAEESGDPELDEEHY